METLELVRRRARARRREIAPHSESKGLTGWSVVETCSRQQGYDLFPLEPEDSLLNGAEAVLDRGVEAIFYSADATRDRATALIAHELGHLELHEGTLICSFEDTDASASDEPTPAGAQQVASYGVRERQELQANVYARELLLPRPEARRLFLDEGWTASNLAERCQLPLDLVRQQLCESLLTPEPPEPDGPEQATVEPGSGDADLSLDPFQRAAAEHDGSPLLLEAGPGTGKTRTLIARILRLIRGGAEPASVLALTFSNKAAREITDRVAQVLPHEAPRIWTGTLHAFGLELLRQHHHLVRLDDSIRIYDRSDAIALLEEALPALGLKHHQNLYEPALELREILAAISRAKDELVDAEGYLELARRMQIDAKDAKEREAAEKALEVARVYEMYQRTLDWRKAVDFGDLIMKSTRMLEAHPLVRRAVRLRHRHVLVDEYQDVNRASARLLQQIAGEGQRLWVVGDSRQSIYRFRGASASNMARFEDDFPGAERKALGINYRSSGEIVEAVTRFSRTMRVSTQRLDLQLQSHRRATADPEAPVYPPDLRISKDRASEMSTLAARIIELRDQGVPFAQQGVLCRSNAWLNRLSRVLEAHGIPVLHLGSLFERDEVRDLLSLLWLIVDGRGGALMRVAAFPHYGIAVQDVHTFLEAVREGEPNALELLGQLEKVDGLSPEAVVGFERLGEELADADRESTPWELLSHYLFDTSQYLRDLLSERSPRQPMRCIALYQFLNFVRQARPGGRGYPPTRLLDKVRRLVLLAEERDLRQIPATALHLDGVKLMTLHGSKGLEFEAVHLPAMTTSSLPSNFRPPRCPPPKGMVTGPDGEEAADREALRESHHAEEECLFFVGLSRCKTHLHLYRPRKSGSVRRSPSRFLAPLRLATVQGLTGTAAKDALDSASGHLAISIEGDATSISGRDLGAYARCPRRYFYSHLFELAGTLRVGAFLKTHRALYDVLDWVKTQAPGPFPDEEATVAQLNDAWRRLGPSGHAFEPQYRGLADHIIANLLKAYAGARLESVEPLTVGLPAGTVTVEPDLWTSLPEDRLLLRILRTGRRGSFRADDTLYGLFEAGARLRYGLDGFDLEVLHLTDRRRTVVNMSLQKVYSRVDKSQQQLADLRAGKFPPRPEANTCPRCPYFFVCPTVPAGSLSLKSTTTQESSKKVAT
ncbi:MAG: ATP-dependent helicase [Acidobacteriota bacterium]